MTKARFLDKAVKRLERRFGIKINLVNPKDEGNFNFKTGRPNRTFTRLNGILALVHRTRTDRDFAYDLSYLAANKNFVYGGLFKRGTVDVTIRKSRIGSFKVTKETLIDIGDGYFWAILRFHTDKVGDYFHHVTIQRTETAALAKVSVNPVKANAVAKTTGPTVVIA